MPPRKGHAQTLLPATQTRTLDAAPDRKTLAKLDARLAADAAERFIKDLGGRTLCGELFALAAEGEGTKEDPKAVGPLETLSLFLLDPRYGQLSLVDLCERAGLRLQDLFKAYRSAALVRAQIVSTARIAAHLPNVVEDVMRRAAPYDDACVLCHGVGTVTSAKTPDAAPSPCVGCGGTGRVMMEPELDRQKLALELGDLVKRGGGISVTQQTLNVNDGTAVGGYERLQQSLVAALSGPLPTREEAGFPPELVVVDAAVVEGETGD